ncbi:hypothetical protein [Mangrovibacterium lignilyticum]|uniref:hypothetical protein n=1 Tax=Mangrovibacterium lignilyticum TaxID=2668052 RepID=UPI0013D1F607|nr:hypothetical protein [Mangrovibacterium lignilyticum]
MFKVETSKTIAPEMLQSGRSSLPERIGAKLKAIGFINITQQGNKISFHANLTDPDAESFQRKYGNGELYISDGAQPTIRVVTDKTRDAVYSVLLSLLIFIAANYGFIFRSDVGLAFILVFNAILIPVSVMQVLRNRCNCKGKQEELLDLLEEKLKADSQQ